ncbi:MAG: S8 family serine peptidase, partial [Mycobacterium sp.]
YCSGSGCPGGRPVPVGIPNFDGSKPLRFRPDGRTKPGPATDPVIPEARRRLQAPAIDTADGSSTIVAIFDTWPVTARDVPDHDVVPLRQFLGTQTPPYKGQNLWLEDAAQRRMGAGLRVHDGYIAAGTVYNLRCLRYTCEGHPEPQDDISSHGLFAASIVADMAPRAIVSVYRVLDNYGMGDMITIAGALEDAIAEAAAEQPPRKLVANFSLAIAPPIWLVNMLFDDKQIDDAYFLDLGAYMDRTRRDTGALIGNRSSPTNSDNDLDFIRRQRLAHASENRLINMLAVPNILFSVPDLPDLLIVGAAGNDSCGDQAMLPARLPGALEGALAVSAWIPTAGGWQPAGYSNDDDFFPDNDGIGAFGGDAYEPPPSTKDRVDTRQGYGVMGLYIGSTVVLPNDGGADTDVPNLSGWAEWAGTSFAAPVASGFAAALWSAA